MMCCLIYELLYNDICTQIAQFEWNLKQAHGDGKKLQFMYRRLQLAEFLHTHGYNLNLVLFIFALQ
jgi:hypothetical protein